jgi:YggT family protein
MNLYVFLLSVVRTLLSAYGYILIAAAVITWIPDLTETPLGQLLMRVTEPYLRLFRRFIPTIQFGNVGFDLSFIVALIVYFFVEHGVVNVLFSLI